MKTEFTDWANARSATSVNIPDGEVTDYYYDAHDEITHSLGDSDVILVGDVDYLEDAYRESGIITINTILNKHQTFTINATATLESKEIKSVNISLIAPTIGDEIVNETVVDPETGDEYLQPNKFPMAASTTDNVEIDYTYWITGAYNEMGEGYDAPFSGVFEEGKYYYVEIGIYTTNGYTLADGLVLTVNGESPAEVFGIYDSGKATFCIAKIKAVTEEEQQQQEEETKSGYSIVEGANQTYTINKSSDLVAKADGDREKLVELRVDGKALSEKDCEIKVGSTIAILKTAYLNTLSEGKHTLTFVYDDGEVSTDFTVVKTNNPATGDNIAMYFAMFAVATLGMAITVKANKKQSR